MDGITGSVEFGEIETQCNIMMNAGDNTTAIQLTNVLNLLIKHLRVIDKPRTKLDQVNSNEGIFPYEKVKNLPPTVHTVIPIFSIIRMSFFLNDGSRMLRTSKFFIFHLVLEDGDALVGISPIWNSSY